MINWALLASYLLSLIVMIGLPILLAFVAVKRFHVSWWVILAGVVAYAMFYLSTVGVDKLFSNGILPVPPTTWPIVLRIVIFGLISGLLEEGFRWLVMKLLGTRARKVASAPALGFAHGGAETILYGVLAIGVPLTTYLFYSPGHQIAKGTDINSVQTMLSSISAFWAQPFYTGLVQGALGLVTISVQILLSILIWKSITERNFLWFVLAVIYQTILFLFNNYMGQMNLPNYVIIATMFLIFLCNVYLAYRIFTDETEAEEDAEEEDGDEEDEEELEGEAKDIEDEEEEELSDPESSLDETESPDKDASGHEEIGK